MSKMDEFIKYRSEILSSLKEIKHCNNDEKYFQRMVGNIEGWIGLIELIDINDLKSEEAEEVAVFIDYVKDTLNEYKNQNALEPNA